MSALSNPIHEPVVRTGQDALARLAELGVDPKHLETALIAGDAAARQADSFAPVTASGTYRWMSTVQVLRSSLAADGWAVTNVRNSARSVSPAGDTAIVAVRGNVDTGVVEGSPRTANPRGKATAMAVHINGGQELALPLLMADAGSAEDTEVRTWFLLYYPTDDGQVRAELSLPVEISEKGMVERWTERLVLAPVDFGARDVVPLDAGDSDDFDDLDFTVVAI